jgi:hypothetical protein
MTNTRKPLDPEKIDYDFHPRSGSLQRQTKERKKAFSSLLPRLKGISGDSLLISYLLLDSVSLSFCIEPEVDGKQVEGGRCGGG